MISKKRVKKMIQFFVFLLILSILSNIFLSYIIYWNEDFYKSKLESYNLFYKLPPDVAGIDGMYHSDGNYYCVWVHKKSLTEIEKTNYHEMCHSLVEENYPHFCEGAVI